MVAVAGLEEEFVKQCGRVAFSAYSKEEDLKDNQNTLAKEYGGRPINSQRSPVVFESDHEVQVVFWELKDEKGPYCAIGIRGTDTFQNGLQDLKCRQVNLDSSESSIFNSLQESPPPKVHRGFRETFLAMRSKILHTLEQDFAEVCGRIVVAGHSLGGAIAVLVGLDLAQNFQGKESCIFLVTFGKPHVGNKAFQVFFCKQFNGHMLAHFRSSADPVPQICRMASAAGAGTYEHECEPHVLDCLVDQALEALPLVASATSWKANKSALNACGTETKKLVMKFHSCSYYWEQLQVFTKPDRKSAQRVMRACNAGYKAVVAVSKATSKSSTSNTESSSLILQKMVEMLQQLPKSRGLPPNVQMAAGATLAVVATCSAAWIAMRGSEEKVKVSEALSSLEDGQQQLQIGVRQIWTSVARLQREVEELKDGQHRIERMIGDLSKEIKSALQDLKIMEIKSNCQMMLDLLVSKDAKRIQEAKTDVLKESARDKATLKTHLQEIWEQLCAPANHDNPEHDLDDAIRRRIEMLCVLLVQSIQLELSYRSALCSHGDQEHQIEHVEKEMHRHVSFCVLSYGPTLGRMAWVCAKQSKQDGTKGNPTFEAIAERFRIVCGCNPAELEEACNADVMDVVLSSKTLQDAESDKVEQQGFEFTADDWYSILALDNTNNEAKLVLAGSGFQSQTLPLIARHHFELALACAPRRLKAKERQRLATLDGITALCLDDKKLGACRANDKAKLRSALFDLTDVVWDADRLADFLVALSRLLPETSNENIAGFPLSNIAPQVWEHLSERVRASSWEEMVLAGAKQLLLGLFPSQGTRDCDENGSNPATKESTLRAWDALTLHSRRLNTRQHENAVDQACMSAIQDLQATLVKDSVSYNITYNQASQHVIVAFASKGTEIHFDVGPKDEAAGPQNRIAVMCALAGEGPEVNAHVLSLLKTSVDLSQLIRKVASECRQRRTRNFVFTGHGIPGSCGMLAMATFLFSKPSELVGLAGHVVTFGAPQVFRNIESYPDLQPLHSKSRCYVHDCDFAPMLFLDWGQPWREFWRKQSSAVKANVLQQQKQLAMLIAMTQENCEKTAQELEMRTQELALQAKDEQRQASTRGEIFVALAGVAATAATGGLATAAALAAGGAAMAKANQAEERLEELKRTIKKHNETIAAAEHTISEYSKQLASVAPSSAQKMALICHHVCEACTMLAAGQRYSTVGQLRLLELGEGCEVLAADDSSEGRLRDGYAKACSAAESLDLKSKAGYVRGRLFGDHELACYDKAMTAWMAALPNAAVASATADIRRCLADAGLDVSMGETLGVSRSKVRKSASGEEEPKEEVAGDVLSTDLGQNDTSSTAEGACPADASEHGFNPGDGEPDVDVDDIEIERWVLLLDTAHGEQENHMSTNTDHTRASQSGAPPAQEEGCCCVVS